MTINNFYVIVKARTVIEMGIYLNPGNDAFEMACRDDIYVDKSGLIDLISKRIGKRKRFVCVSRPRRFGKSMAAEMLTAYYDRTCDSGKLFCDKKIVNYESYETHLNQYNVIYLNVQHFLRGAGEPENLVSYMEAEILKEVKELYGDWIPSTTSLPVALANIYVKDSDEKKGFIFIVDEWDCIFRVARENTIAQRKYLDFLRDLFKDRTYVKLAYMTGILPIKKYGNHSALNDFDEFSMTNPDCMSKYMGFTQQEVRKLCEDYHKDFQEVRRWYDGYRMGENLHVYNPKSVVDGMQSRKLKSFWTNTETYEALQIYIDLDEDGLKQALIAMLSGERCEIDTGAFQNDMTTFKSKDDVLTLLVHLGYLSYDETMKTVSIPNEEVREEFVRAVKNGRHKEIVKLITESDKLLDATLQMDVKSVSKVISRIHDTITAPNFYNNEQALRSVIKFAYLSCMEEFIEIQELPSGIGYADVVFLPKKSSNKPVMIVELKWNKTATSALKQIKDRKYPQVLENYGGEILLVGVNYSEKTKEHTCVIEIYQKK